MLLELLMKTITIFNQIKNNTIAITSVVVAIMALSYNTWRNEHSEKNRNTRTASFEVLKGLDELQVVINYSHYQHGKQMGNPYLAWGHIGYISDLSQLLPPPIPENIQKLVEVWEKNWTKVKTDDAAVDTISNQIDHSRESVLSILRQLK